MKREELTPGLIIVHNNPYDWEGQREVIMIGKTSVMTRYINCGYPDLEGKNVPISFGELEEDYKIFESVADPNFIVPAYELPTVPGIIDQLNKLTNGL